MSSRGSHWRAVVVLAVGWALAGCALSNQSPPDLSEKKTVRLVQSFQYPELPDLEVPKLDLLPVHHELPRDMTADLVVRNTTKCRGVAEADRRGAFWEDCGIHPPLPDSNLYRGYDRDNWTNFWINDARIQAHIAVLRGMLEQVSRQRADWRRKAEQQRARETEQADAPAQ